MQKQSSVAFVSTIVGVAVVAFLFWLNTNNTVQINQGAPATLLVEQEASETFPTTVSGQVTAIDGTVLTLQAPGEGGAVQEFVLLFEERTIIVRRAMKSVEEIQKLSQGTGILPPGTYASDEFGASLTDIQVGTRLDVSGFPVSDGSTRFRVQQAVINELNLGNSASFPAYLD